MRALLLKCELQAHTAVLLELGTIPIEVLLASAGTRL